MSMDACSLFRPCSHNSASLPSQKYALATLGMKFEPGRLAVTHADNY